ncbi:TolC family protein [Vulgatibacter sp.]|uniref:TolC family protein n=1 Tax=Vulgatibacter sp. TaxID=1971226 RepID=UPI003567689F
MIPDRSKNHSLRRPLALATALALLAPGFAVAQEEQQPAQQQPETRPVQPGSNVQAPAEAPELIIDPDEVVPQADAPVLTLEEAVRRADLPEGALDLTVLRENLERANINVQRAWASLLPVVNLVGSYTRNSVAAEIAFPNFAAGLSEQPAGSGVFVPNEFVPVDIQPENQWGAQLEATMPLLVMPAYYGIANARQATELVENQITFARNELIFGLTQAYYGAVAAKRIIEVSAAQLASAREQERVAQARFDVGEIPKVGYLRAAVQRSRFEQDLVRAQNAYVSAKLAIAALIGVEEPFTVVAPPEVEVPAAGSIDEYVRAGLQRRRDLAAQRDAVEIAERAVKAAYWQFAPVIAANGAYRWANVGGFTGETETWAVTVSAIFTIFDWNRYADVDEAKSQLAQSRAERENLSRTVSREVKTALLELESARANLISAEEASRLAKESATLVRAQYEAGAATYLDVIDANATEFAADVSVVTEQLNAAVAALRLSRSMGTFGVERFP